MALDPQLAEILAIAEKAGRPPLEALPVDQARREYKKRADTFGLPRAEMAAIEERTVAGPAGAIPVRFYVPAGATDPSPLLVFFHGGGWTVGDRDTHDRACRYLAAAAQCRVASVDYRLAPEHPFPAAVDDSWAAWRAIAGDARGRKCRSGPARGGRRRRQQSAAVVAQLARERAAPAPCFQLLIYRRWISSSRTRNEPLRHRLSAHQVDDRQLHRPLHARSREPGRSARLAAARRQPRRAGAGLHPDRRVRSAARQGRRLRKRSPPPA
ncbi:MAG: alpha/beta hydrolase fold domain-containing protein [Rhodospirillaceae bacterium]|nr:alpha/beta hydrolase fold domain-containing protein [Rhodospirillaceae bacterium]